MMQKQSGVALIMTLWVLVLLSAVAMSFSFSSRRGNASTRNFKEDTQAYYLAVSAFEDVIAWLIDDRDLAVDLLDEEGNFVTDDERPTINGVRETENSTVEVLVTDEESKLNINALSREAVLRLFSESGVPDPELQALADALADWMDPDDLYRLSGAEDEYYEGLGYTAKNRMLDTMEEMLYVKGFLPEYLYSTEEEGATPLVSLVTTFKAGVNVNTVPRELLYILGIDDISINNIMRLREIEGGLRSVPRELAGFGTTSSAHIRVQVTSRIADNPQGLKITAVLQRDKGKDGLVLKTLYWKEELATGGA